MNDASARDKFSLKVIAKRVIAKRTPEGACEVFSHALSCIPLRDRSSSGLFLWVI